MRWSLTTLKVEQPIVLVSPHFDDAVLSCGHLLACKAYATVVTLFGGDPGLATKVSTWDAPFFPTATEAVETRCLEDRHALSVLGANQVRMQFLDYLYREEFGRGHRGLTHNEMNSGVALLRTMLLDLRARTCLAPLGLHHPDHRIARQMVIAALRRTDGRVPARPRLVLYEDVPYVRNYNRQEIESFAASLPLRFKEVAPPTPSDEHLRLKAAAVECYRSQIAALDDAYLKWRWCLDRDGERYWVRVR
jgi:LmbE family N-acetylglucosaminyl deacetylase